MTSLQEELEKVKAQVVEVTKRTEKAKKQVEEAKDHYLAEGRVEGYDLGKRDAELSSIKDYLASEDFTAKRKEIIEEFMCFEELTNIRTKDLQSAKKQIVEQIKQHHPE